MDIDLEQMLTIKNKTSFYETCGKNLQTFQIFEVVGYKKLIRKLKDDN